VKRKTADSKEKHATTAASNGNMLTETRQKALQFQRNQFYSLHQFKPKTQCYDGRCTKCIRTNRFESNEVIFTKIRGISVNILVKINPEMYNEYTLHEGDNKVIYKRTLKVFYGMIQSALFCYKKFRNSLEEIGFKVNNYDPCVAKLQYTWTSTNSCMTCRWCEIKSH
jgi:hypothetical protein